MTNYLKPKRSSGGSLSVSPSSRFVGVVPEEDKRTVFMRTTDGMFGQYQGSNCGTVGRAVAYDNRGRQFKSQSWAKFILNISLLPTVLKTRKKFPGIANLKKFPTIANLQIPVESLVQR